MPAAVDRLQFAPPPQPGMLRALGLALIAHLLLMLALGWGINWKRESTVLSAEAELWSTVPQEAAPKLVAPPPPPPAPAPTPAPPPAPAPVAEPPKPEPAPRAADIALEREKDKLAEARRKQLALEREREREQKREAERELAAKKKAAAEKKLEAQREAEDRHKQDQAKAKAAEDKKKLEAAKREKADEQRMAAQRQANIERMKGMAGATGGPEAKGTALRASGPSPSYAGRVAARVKPNIVFTEEITGNPRAEIEVRTSPDGTIVGQRILKSSGVKAWDDAVLKAVIKTEVLPRDTDGRVPSPLIIDFRPKD